MQLVTSRFGGIEFDASDIVVFDKGICEYIHDRQWLLVADACDDHLYWLQSISDSRISIPVLSVEILPFAYRITTVDREFRFGADQLLVLLPIEQLGGSLSIDLHLPIVIDAKSSLGLQLRNERYQPMQRLSSAPPTLLRQSA